MNKILQLAKEYSILISIAFVTFRHLSPFQSYSYNYTNLKEKNDDKRFG